MKNFKKSLAITLVLTMLVVFTGCSGDTVGTSKKESSQQSISKTPTTKAPQNRYVYDNDTVRISGVCEFYIESSQITPEVEPLRPADYYNVYEAETGQTYVDIIVSYKNLSTAGVRADRAIGGASLVYDNTYKYSGFVAIEENDRSDFALFARSTEISPLTTGYIHMIFQVPQEVANSSNSIKVNFSINNTEYRYNVR